MKPNIEDTDIIIRRVSNGWIVFSGSEYEADHFIVTVYEEGETEWGEHEALIGLFREHFDAYTQSKKRGGIKLEVREKGYDYEEDEEDEEDMCFIKAEREFMDAALNDVLEVKSEATCDVCGRVKDSCKNPPYEEKNER